MRERIFQVLKNQIDLGCWADDICESFIEREEVSFWRYRAHGIGIVKHLEMKMGIRGLVTKPQADNSRQELLRDRSSGCEGGYIHFRLNQVQRRDIRMWISRIQKLCFGARFEDRPRL